ncbi:hypothetical protein FRC02_006904 [Tulasnella sp. 418]|nr:hypothetical protein FRC02_006904 [Tulasnella sp. 418]
MNDDNSSSLPPQTFTGHDRLILPDKQELLGAYKGYHVSNLRTPAFIVDRSIVEHNCAGMLASTKSLKAKFRAHVKTHKTIEVLRLQLSSGGHTSQSVVVSTLMEAWNIVNESSDGLVKDLLYGLPVSINKIADIWDLTMSFQNDDRSFRLLVDHPDQVKGLLAFWHTQPDGPYLFNPRWSLFVKVDADYK